MLGATAAAKNLPVLVIGAGISGLLLAQQLRKQNVPFHIYERDDDFSTRGFGWGLTLHWSLPALRELLPNDLLEQLPSTCVDLNAVKRGASSTFPFFDLSTGELKSSSPRASADERIRVTRERLRMLLASRLDIQVRCVRVNRSDYVLKLPLVGQSFPGLPSDWRCCDGKIRRRFYSSRQGHCWLRWSPFSSPTGAIPKQS